MRASRFAEAYALLRQSDAATAQDPALQFLLGQCAYELGHYAQAIFHYRAILARQPDSPRVHAELGKAYLADKQGAAAQKEFEAALAAHPPEHVRADILQLMAAAQQPKNWSARLALGYVYDDNVNIGPNTMSVLLFGIPFELTPSSAPQSDKGLRATFSGVHLNALSATAAWQSEVSVDLTDYRDLNAFDYLQYFALTGPKWRTPQQLISLPLVLEHAELGHDKYSDSYGLLPQVEYALNSRLTLKGGLSLQRKTFPTQPLRSGPQWAALVALRRSGAGAGEYVEMSYRHIREDADAKFLDNRSDWLSFAYYATWRGLSLYLEPTIGWIEYAEREAVFDAARTDVRYLLTVNVSKNFRNDSFTVALGWTLIRNRSSISINEYDRSLVTILATRNF